MLVTSQLCNTFTSLTVLNILWHNYLEILNCSQLSENIKSNKNIDLAATKAN